MLLLMKMMIVSLTVKKHIVGRTFYTSCKIAVL